MLFSPEKKLIGILRQLFGTLQEQEDGLLYTWPKQMENWRQEHFLLDAGAPRSFLWRPLARDLDGDWVDSTLQCEVDGCQVAFEVIAPTTQTPGFMGSTFLEQIF